MNKKLFVGSLPFSVTSSQIEELFAKYGKVISADLITDRMSGQSKGFAFVEMATEEEAQKAIKELNNYNLDGRTIVVNIARPKEDRPNSGFQRRDNYSRSDKRW